MKHWKRVWTVWNMGFSWKTLSLLAERGTAWFPTFAPVGNLLGCGRFPDEEIQKNLDMQMKNVKKSAQIGAHIGLGSDAGAYLVPHGTGTRDEYQYLRSAGVVDDVLEKTEMQVRDLFSL